MSVHPKAAHNAYRTTAVQTASQSRLIAMLFEGAAKFMHIFIDATQNKKIEIAHLNSIKAQRIITELIVALDHNKGGDVSRVIQAAYEDIRNRMAMSNIKKDVEMAQKVIEDLGDFKRTWEQVFKSVSIDQPMPPEHSGVSIKT
ncbi:MAG: flagellar export chaperone FliS [Candidatus Lindowbacteria bacterium]|nr:flagellar export chaperone FliS [Candidatus Lindowbacteria bacterium]